MKSIQRWLKSILGIAIFALLASCASTYVPPTSSTLSNMSVKEARRKIVSDLAYTHNIINYSSDARITSYKLIHTSTNRRDGATHRAVTTFGDIAGISVDSVSIKVSDRNSTESYIVSDQAGVANAFYVLKENAIRQKILNAEYDARFAASLPDYRKRIGSGVPFPEQVIKYKVQAEGAVRDKKFDDAADYYAEALTLAPWWPVGHFNRALVLGEAGDYGDAKSEMRYYLQLVPDAPNARAAQDKIYDWERLESQ